MGLLVDNFSLALYVRILVRSPALTEEEVSRSVRQEVVGD